MHKSNRLKKLYINRIYEFGFDYMYFFNYVSETFQMHLEKT